MKRLPALLTTTSLMLAGACTFDFSRGGERQPGEVEGRALRADDGSAAPFARVELQGTAVPRRARADGLFVLSGLGEGQWALRIVDDPDGDGEPDRAAWRAVTLRSVDEGGKQQLTWVLLGDVPLEGTARARGTLVTEDDAALPAGGRVYVFRQSDELTTEQLAGTASDAFAGRSLGAEAEASVPASGSFDVGGFAPGALKLVAVHPGDETRGALMSEVVELQAAPLAEIDVGTLQLEPVTTTRAVLVDLAFDPPLRAGDEYDVTVVPAGQPREGTAIYAERRSDPSTLTLELPLGAYDLYLDSAPGSRVFHGVLLSQLAWAPLGDEPAFVRWGALHATTEDACRGAFGDVDRDGDGLRGLPSSAAAPEAWDACTTPCAASIGTAAGDVTCTFGGVTFDCDDDHDGQPDTDERDCVSACSGTDLDQDGICDRADPDVATCRGEGCQIENDGGTVDDAGPVLVDAGPTVGCTAAASLAADGRASGTLVGGTDDLEACFASGSDDAIYSFTSPGRLHDLTASLAGSDFDTLLSVYAGSCDAAGQLACNDDAVAAASRVSIADAPAGEHFLVVEGYQGAAGAYELEVSGSYALGEPCDPALSFLSCVAGSCEAEPGGGRRCTGPRDCDDDVDADDDGISDEDADRCTTPPVLSCPAPLESPVLSSVSISASASDDGAVSFRRWSIVSAPLGSSLALSNATTDEVSLTPLLAGSYVLRYLAADDEGQLSACLVDLEVTTDDVFRVELVWNVDVPSGDPTDLDLHLLHPLPSSWFDPQLDCHFENCRSNALSWRGLTGPGAPDAGVGDADAGTDGGPDGGAGGPVDAGPDPSPSLDIDDIDGRGPENINVTAPEEGAGPYRVGVHYFADDGFGPSSAYVKVFCHGQLAGTFGPTTLRTGATPDDNEFWKVADVAFVAGACDVTPLVSGDGGPEIVTRAAASIAR